MHPDIEAAKALLYGAIRDLTPAEAEAPIEGKWSIAGIVEHLVLTYSRSAQGMQKRTAKGSAPVRNRTLRQQLQQFIVVSLGYFPPGRESPKLVRPEGRPFGELMSELDDVFDQLDSSLASAGHALGSSSAVLDHPILGPFSVNQWRTFHVVHTRHHVKQILDRRQKSEGRS